MYNGQTEEPQGWLDSVTGLPGRFYDFVTSVAEDPYADKKPLITRKKEQDGMPELYDHRNLMPPAPRAMPGSREPGRHRLNPLRER